MSGPSLRQGVLSSGNETLDKFLGGGLLNSSLNLFERQGPSSRILETIINKSFASAAVTRGDAVIFVNFNTSVTLKEEEILSSLPATRKVKSELMYQDIRDKSAVAKIKIAWRYSQQATSSPSDGVARMSQIDFGVALVKSSDPCELGPMRVINVSEGDTICLVLKALNQKISDLKSTCPTINIILKDLTHPFSPLIDDESQFMKFLYALRCLSRQLEKGSILACYDCGFFEDHFNIEQRIYNLADCVVSFYSYETEESKLTGYKDIDGTMSYIKVPKINSYGFHFQQDLSDWGYRLTRNLRYFVVDELSLPPCDDDNEEGKGKQTASDLIKIENVRQPLQQVGPLEEFRHVAKDVIAKRL